MSLGKLTLWERIKFGTWWLIAPAVPYLRDFLLWLHLIHHRGRQDFHIGWLPMTERANGLRDYLIHEKGFEDHFPCWIDDGEMVDLRFRESFRRQYHLRIFNDGEIRGHYEYTPEDHPFAHITDRGMEDRRDDFQRFLGYWVTTERPR